MPICFKSTLNFRRITLLIIYAYKLYSEFPLILKYSLFLQGDVPTLGGIESTGHTEVAPYTDDLISHFSLNVLPIGGLSSIQVGSITNVTKQVVAGISYKGTILYLVKPTDYTQKMYTVTCDFNIWIRSWLEPPMDKIISETCDTSVRFRLPRIFKLKCFNLNLLLFNN